MILFYCRSNDWFGVSEHVIKFYKYFDVTCP